MFNFNKDDEYYTPKEFVALFGKFDYDPATTVEKAKEFDIPNYDTIETDGLSKDWTIYNKIWLNPPFTLKTCFLKKAVETFKTANNQIYILFPVGFLTTKKFHETMKNVGGVLYVPNKRICFEHGSEGLKTGPGFGSVVLKLGDNKDIVIKRIVI